MSDHGAHQFDTEADDPHPTDLEIEADDHRVLEELEAEKVQAKELEAKALEEKRTQMGLQRRIDESPTGALDVAALAITDPETAVIKVEAWMEAVNTLTKGAMQRSPDNGWLVHKNGTRMTAMPIKAACVALRAYRGIHIVNLRPVDGSGIARPIITSGTNNKGTPYRMAEMFADGFCQLTGVWVRDVRGVVRDDEQFVGRAGKGGDAKTGIVMEQDLAERCRTTLENKITRLLSNVTAVPIEELAKVKGTTIEDLLTRVQQGSGFGSSQERQAAAKDGSGGSAPAAEATPETTARAVKFWKFILEMYGGENDKALIELKACAEFGDKTITDHRTLGARPRWLDSTIKKWNDRHPSAPFA